MNKYIEYSRVIVFHEIIGGNMREMKELTHKCGGDKVSIIVGVHSELNKLTKSRFYDI